MLKQIRIVISLVLLKVAVVIMPSGSGTKSHAVSSRGKSARITVEVNDDKVEHYNYI